MVVAPYNAQVLLLRERLPSEVEVGTVDNFQGREAAIVFYSMALSRGENVRRGLDCGDASVRSETLGSPKLTYSLRNEPRARMSLDQNASAPAFRSSGPLLGLPEPE